METEILNISLVKSKHGIFINSMIKNYHDYLSHHDLKNYLVDGEKPEQTCRVEWYKVKQIPTKIEKVIAGFTTILKYKLKEGYTPNEIMLAEVDRGFFYDEDEEKFNSHLESFYDKITETTPDKIENVEFKLNIYEQYKDFKVIKLDFTPVYDLVSTIVTPGIFWSEIPARICIEDSYKIIRKYIQQNIDGRYGKITSDYDFCFAVEKNIGLAEPEEYEYKKYKNYRDKRGTTAKGLRTTRAIKIFDMAPKKYNDYKLAPSFEAESSVKLQEKIDEFCKDLITKINEPLKDCIHCKGRGVIIEKE